MRGPVAVLLARSEALRIVYLILVFIPVSLAGLLISFTGRMGLMVPLWHSFAACMGVTQRVHGAKPPADEPAVWVSNHYNWFDWPMLQVAAPYKLFAVVKARAKAARKRAAGPAPQETGNSAAGRADTRRWLTQADIAMENPVARLLAAWCFNLGAIFYTRGDRKSGAVRGPRPPGTRPPGTQPRLRFACAARAHLRRGAGLTRAAPGRVARGRRCGARFLGTRALCLSFRRAPRRRTGRRWLTSCAMAPSRLRSRPASSCSRYACYAARPWGRVRSSADATPRAPRLRRLRCTIARAWGWAGRRRRTRFGRRARCARGH